MHNKNSVKYLYTIVIFLITALILQGCSDDTNPFENVDQNVSNTNYSASETFSQNVAVNSQNALVLEGVSGTIDFKVTNGPLVKIYGERRVESQSIEDAEIWLPNLKVQVEDRGNEVFVKTVQPSQTNGRNLIVNYNVEIPATWSVHIDNVNGNVKIDSVTGGVDINLVNGRIVLNDLFCNVNANLTNGNIESRLALPQQGSVIMNLINGSIDLLIPASTSAEIDASVVNGSIQTENLSFQNLTSSARRLNGTMASGQGQIDLATVNGTINILGY